MMISNNARRVVDFSAYMEEARARRIPRVLKIGDSEYPLPSGLPATITVGLLAFQSEHGENAEPGVEIVYPMLVDIFGEDHLRDIVVTHAMETDDLVALLDMVMTKYTETPSTEGNAPAPATPLTLSSTGD